MGILQFRPKTDMVPVANAPVRPADAENVASKEAKIAESEATSDSDSETVSTEVQYGVQKAQATTLTWSKSHIWIAYVL